MNEAGTWTFNVATQNFSYDRYGNRCVSSATGGVSNYCPSYTAASNRISSLTYDAAGNIMTDVATGGTMTYDAENHMLTATNGGGGSYTYDGEGKRVKRQIAGQEWWYVYGIGGELLAEYLWTAPTTVKKEYAYRSGQLLVVWDNDKSGNDRLKWLVTDHLGSTRMEANLSGSLGGMRRHDYAPFGEELSAGIRQNGGQGQYGYEPPASNIRQKFDGYERDGETGLDYAQARYFASVQGRFTSVDPLMASGHVWNPQSWNRYSFALNRPLGVIDPTGLEGQSVSDIVFDALEGQVEEARNRDEQQRRRNQQQQQQQQQGRRILIIVGDPGLNEHNVGNNFQRTADTRQAELERQGAEVISVRVSNVAGFNYALNVNGTLNGVEYFGHATNNALFVGETSDPGTNLDASNVSQLSNAHLSQDATIKINACYAGLGGDESIAAGIAQRLNRPVTAYDGSTRFSSNPNHPDGRKQPPKTGPIYLVPDPGVRQRTFTPRH